MPGYISPEQLELLIRRGRERRFVLIDVRPVREFSLDHIPGAVNIPLSGLDTSVSDVEEYDQVVFYCRNGVRSKVAALIASEAGLPDSRIFHLHGGMAAYFGEILLDMPRLEIFPDDMPLDKVLDTAIQLEKGAWIFYRNAAPIFKNTPAHTVMLGMQDAEEGHARMIFELIRKLDPGGPSFDTVFRKCRGDILEGGKNISEIQNAFGAATAENRSDILDFALDMEYAAYDLYKNSAFKFADHHAEKIFVALAQAEKTHIADILACIDRCC